VPTLINRSRLACALPACLAGLALAWTPTVQAQAPIDATKDPVETRSAAAHPPDGPQPIRLGSFIFHPTGSLALAHTDNALLDNSKLSDLRWDIGLGARLQSDWARHSLVVDIQENLRRHFDYKSEDQGLSSDSVEGRYDLADAWRLMGLAKFDDAAVSKANPNRQPGLSQQQTHTLTTAGQLQYEGTGYWAHLLLNREVTENDSKLFGPGVDLTNRLDQRRNDVAFFPGLKLGTTDRVFAIVTRTETRFDAPDPSVQARNMDGHHLGVGFTRQSEAIKLEARLWRFTYDFADPALRNMRGTQAYVSASWRPSPQWGLNGKAQRSFEPTTIPGSPGQYVNDLSAAVQWALDAQWSVEANVGRTRYSAVDAPVVAPPRPPASRWCAVSRRICKRGSSSRATRSTPPSARWTTPRTRSPCNCWAGGEGIPFQAQAISQANRMNTSSSKPNRAASSAAGESQGSGERIDVHEHGRQRAQIQSRLRGDASRDIAVIGLACRFPGVDSPEAFWDMLVEGRETVTRWTDEEMLADGADPQCLKLPNWVKAGPVLEGVEGFDAEFFGITAKEAMLMDPQHRVFMECAWEACEHAGYDPRRMPGQVGVFGGVGLDMYYLNNVWPNRHTLSEEGFLDRMNNETADGFGWMIASDKDYVTTRVSYRFGFTGPSVNVQTACSTGLTSVHMAVNSLLLGECDYALAGGTHVKTPQKIGYPYQPGMMLSADGHCRAFSDDATGTLFGNGGGMVLLKRLSDALRDGDHVVAVVKGTAIHNDGVDKTGYTAPSDWGQARTAAEALAVAGIAPETVTYIEAHGTGTQVGDPIEFSALRRAYTGTDGVPGRTVVGSVKTNTGHLQVAAGIAGFIKAALMLQHRRIPPILHLVRPNPKLKVEGSAFRFATRLEEWNPAGVPRRAAVNSLGIGGTNAHALLEEFNTGVAGSAGTTLGSPAQLLTLSARTPAALKALAQRYRDWFTRHPGLQPADVAFTATQGRTAFACRLSVVGNSLAQWQAGLDEHIAALDERAPRGLREGLQEGQRARVAFLFTGQGAQWAGMGRDLYDTRPVFRQVIDRCAAIFDARLPQPLLPVMWGAAGTEGLLDQTLYTQPALFSFELAMAELWRSWGLEPVCVLGHSVGEIAAAVLAGVFTLEDGATLVAERARLMHSLPAEGSMAAVLMPLAALEEQLARHPAVTLAAANGPSNQVVAGPRAAVAALVQSLQAEGITCKPLAVSLPMHTAWLDPILPAWEEACRRVAMRAPTGPVLLSNPQGGVAGPEVATAAYWVRHARQPVRFADNCNALLDLGVDIAIEVGPKATLAAFLQQAAELRAGGPDSRLPVLASLKPRTPARASLLEALGQAFAAGAEPQWEAVLGTQPARRVPLPTYPFQRVRLWVDPPPVAATKAGAATGAVLEAGDASAHPLLGALRDAPGDHQAYEVRIGFDRLPWLADHQVFGEPWFPTTGYLEMLRAAAGPNGAVCDFAIERSLPLAGDLSLTTLLADGDSLAVYSKGDDGWRRHASARLAAPAQEDATAASIDLAQWRGRCPQAVDLERHFAGCARKGIDYGPAFRGLAELWRGPDCAFARAVLPSTLDAAPYGIHPALLDACLQAIFAARADDTATWLPVGAERIVWHRNAAAELVCLVTAAAASPPGTRAGECTLDVRLATPAGEPVATLHGLRLRPAATGLMGRGRWLDWLYRRELEDQPLRAGAVPMADYLPSPESLIAPLAGPAHAHQTSEHIAALLQAEDAPGYGGLIAALEPLAARFAAKALMDLGLRFAVDARWDSAALAEQLGVVPAHRRLFARLFDMAAQQGWLLADDGGATNGQAQSGLDRSYWVAAEPPIGDPQADLARLAAVHPRADAELTLLGRCGPRLADVLAGRCDPLRELLFPDGDASVLTRFYAEGPGMRAMGRLVSRTIAALAESLPAHRSLAVLEIGAGTGGTTVHVLPALPADRCDYLFTDVSTAFTNAARSRFAGTPFLRYGILDAEKDPIAQGHAAESFDLVIAANALHATRDLPQTLSHVRRLLKPGGQLVLVEVTAKMGWIDLIFGMTDGWWRFDDAVRSDYALLSPERWHAFLADQGFVATAALGAPQAQGEDRSFLLHQAIILAQKPLHAVQPASAKPWRVLPQPGSAEAAALAQALAASFAQAGAPCQVGPAGEGETQCLAGVLYIAGTPDAQALDTERDGAAMAEQAEAYWQPFLHAVQQVLPEPVPLALAYGGAALQAQPLLATLPAMARVAGLEHAELQPRSIELDASLDLPQAARALRDELLYGPAEPQLRLDAGGRHVQRLAAADPPRRAARDEALLVPEVECAGLALRQAGHLDSAFLEARPRRSPAAGEVEIRVHAAGLTFRDALNALGLLAPHQATPLGSECAGEISAIGEGVEGLAVGQRVMAVAYGSAAHFVLADARCVQPVPAGWRLEEAAGVPVSYVSAWDGLMALAELKRGETVLIHAASGGVGQAAIQIARLAGARIVATASPGKWPALKALGVEHIYSSRDPGFAAELVRDVGGVDVVLNALSGEFVAASFACLKPGGRFVEMGIKDVWSAERAARERPDARFLPLDLLRNPARIGRTLQALAPLFADGRLRPAAPRVHPLHEARTALRTLQRAQHVGKLVLAVPQPARMRADAAYLVTGGLNGLGWLTAGWLAERGAGHLVLVGRRAPAAEVQAGIAALRERGVTVWVEQADVAKFEPLAAIAARLDQAGVALAGIFHAAGALDDGALAQQTPERFRTVTDAKIAGSWNLHRLSAGRTLDHFVLYSSTAALLGNRGQANHAAANAFMDALAHRRQMQGLAALSINWAGWSEIGAAVATNVGERLKAIGLEPIAPREGLAALEWLLAQPEPQCGVAPIAWQRFFAHWGDSPAFARFAQTARQADAGRGVAVAATAKAQPRSVDLARLAELPPDERRQRVADEVAVHTARVLGLSGPGEVDRQRGFFELGLDSLTTVELRNRLQKALGQALPATLAFDHPTVAALAKHLDGRLFDRADAAPAPVAGTAPPSQALRQAVAALDEADAEAALLRELEDLALPEKLADA
jgi:acyl transferase domain-containing protein/NADPH:quinone reductase-like Zn-dependent oxidoreductase/SAM-dependent methyltransferase/NADP-dependent 3-hydroxy acid dehydrogenase YdfG/acyl carrier protein